MSQLWILLFSLGFYFWGEGELTLILILSILRDYLCGLIIERGHRQKIPILSLGGLILSILGNLGVLFYFKYLGFAATILNIPVDPILLPIGISFYTFQSMSYTIDVYRKQVAANSNIINYACYVCMFPQLVAGPIIRYKDVAASLVKRTINSQDVSLGIERFIIGLGKKMIIANTLAVPADQIFGLPSSELSFNVAWFGAFCYTLQIYFDFSGYSDMAIGLGRMMGFRFAENFNYPYIARSVQEFWRRWHISLSTWFRDYLYIPLGGNKKGTPRLFLNLIIVFVLCGFWHGAEWTFLAWGIYHGFFLVMERLGHNLKLPSKIGVIKHFYTMVVIIIGWVLFRAENLDWAISCISSMLGGAAEHASTAMSPYLNRPVRLAFIAGLIFSTPIYKLFEIKILSSNQRLLFSLETVRTFLLISIMTFCVTLLALNTHNPFIYFRF